MKPGDSKGEIQSWLDRAAERLARADIESPRQAAEWLASHVMGRPRLRLLLDPGQAPDLEQSERLEDGLGRLIRGEPLQYVNGEVEFLGRRFMVDRRVLIPRPETEWMAELFLAQGPVWEGSAPVVGDVGTGSGCIAVSLALERPRSKIVATDAMESALEVARLNARRLGADGSIRFVRADLLDSCGPNSLDGLIANPPYIASGAIPDLAACVRDFEPRAALDGGPDGLRLISRLVEQAIHALKPQGWLFMEIGEDQGTRVGALLEAAGFRSAEIRKDWAGKDRIALGMKP